MSEWSMGLTAHSTGYATSTFSFPFFSLLAVCYYLDWTCMDNHLLLLCRFQIEAWIPPGLCICNPNRSDAWKRMNGPCSNMFKLDVQGQAAPSFVHRIAASPCMDGSKQEWGLTAHTSGYAACTFFPSVFFCQLCAFAWIGRTCFIK